MARLTGCWSLLIFVVSIAGCGGGDEPSVDAGPSCDAACVLEPEVVCGDGALDPSEVCDDGNAVSGDGCTPACLIQPGWDCAATAAGDPSTCRAICGDGRRLGAEGCDDGNTAAADGCDAECRPELGWSCGAEGSCTNVCGDGLRVGQETCDDGNMAPLDGCSAECVDVEGWRPLASPDASPSARYEHTVVWTGSKVLVWGGSTPSNSAGGSSYDPQTGVWRAMPTGATSRGRHTAVWTGTEMIVFGGSAGGRVLPGGARYDATRETWTELETNGMPEARMYHAAIWTGTEMIVWGGRTEGGVTASGARYDPVARAWTPLSEVGAPVGRERHSAVWTGREMIVFGGLNGGSRALADGAAYDPSTDTWRILSVAGAPPSRRFWHEAAWTGHEMLIFGGGNGRENFSTGSAYDPSTDAWRTLSTQGEPSPRILARSVWTGSELIVWGGQNGWTSPRLGDGAAYAPAVDAWQSLPNTQAPSRRSSHAAVWLGDRMFVWGGSEGGFDVLGDGALYSPGARSWQAVRSTDTPPSPRENHTSVWTGTEMLVFGGHVGGALGAEAGTETGGRYDPPAARWRATSTSASPSFRANHTAIWAEDRMIVFGGWSGVDPVALGDGAAYSPVEDRWTPLPAANAPDPRYNHSAVWTGSEMIVWGGYQPTNATSDIRLASGASYDPLTNRWSALPATGAPSPRDHHTAVWTGSEMIVFGGRDRGPNSGGRYSPASRAWTPLETEGRPQRRYLHTAIWTGREMIVWGGMEIDEKLNALGTLRDGARFDPERGVWTPVSQADAPSPRFAHTAVWTGAEMVVFGGEAGLGADDALADGARYRPEIDAWIPLRDDTSPSARSGHSAVWTGTSMMIFGGNGGSAFIGDGARYGL